MRRLVWLGLGAAVLACGLAGCEWNTGDDAENWSSTYNWVNFSGVYRNAERLGVLVTDYSVSPADPGSTNEVTTVNELQGAFSAGSTVFSGNLQHDDIVVSSVTISWISNSGEVIHSVSDDGLGGLSGDDNGTGSIQYASGAWSVDFNMNPATESGYIRASYTYLRTSEGSEETVNPGSTGASIYSFSVNHVGQHVTITDNNGAVYKGYISQMRSASGAERTDELDRYMPVEGDTIIASFSCSGTSAAMYQVKIVGTFQGTVQSKTFVNRLLDATWVEVGGRTGDIRGSTTSLLLGTASGSSAGGTTTTETATEETSTETATGTAE